MTWEFEIWQDDQFLSSAEEIEELERPSGSRCLLDASMSEGKDVDHAIKLARKHRVDGLLLGAASDAHAKALGGLDSVDSLDLTGSPVTDAVLPALGKLDRLTSLALRSTQVSGAGLGHLTSLPSLVSLDLSNTPLTPEAVTAMAELTGLRKLWLDGTGLPGAALAPLAALTQLEQLGLAGLELADADLAFLGALTSLTRLDLRGDGGFGDRGLVVIARLGGLRSLNLAGRQQVTGAGLAHLTGLSLLEDVDLSRTQVNGASLTHLAGLPIQRLVCKDLVLTTGDEGDVEAMQEGLGSLASCPGLYYVDLAGTRLDETAVRHLAAIPALEVLVLERTEISPAALIALESHQSLRTVHFSGYRLDASQAAAYGRTGQVPASVTERERELSSLLGSLETGAAASDTGARRAPDGDADAFDDVGDGGLASALAAAMGGLRGEGGRDEAGTPLQPRVLDAIDVEAEDVEDDEGDDDDEPTSEEAEQDARLLLQKLVEAGKVELAPGHTVADLPQGLGKIMETHGSAEARAAAITEWLLDRDEVEEVYYADEELAAVLRVW